MAQLPRKGEHKRQPDQDGHDDGGSPGNHQRLGFQQQAALRQAGAAHEDRQRTAARAIGDWDANPDPVGIGRVGVEKKFRPSLRIGRLSRLIEGLMKIRVAGRILGRIMLRPGSGQPLGSRMRSGRWIGRRFRRWIALQPLSSRPLRSLGCLQANPVANRAEADRPKDPCVDFTGGGGGGFLGGAWPLLCLSGRPILPSSVSTRDGKVVGWVPRPRFPNSDKR